VYAVRVSSVNGLPTANRGSVVNPACTLQFGKQVTRVWLAHPTHENAVTTIVDASGASACAGTWMPNINAAIASVQTETTIPLIVAGSDLPKNTAIRLAGETTRRESVWV